MSRQRVPEGPAPDPAVQKLRVQYAKRGRLRFSSSRDFQRALERALRRAEIPMAFSAGFHPHPRISYANAAPTGTASEAEYFEIQLREHCDPEVVCSRLNEALPEGMDIISVAEAQPGALADRLQASDWRIEFADADAAGLVDAVAQLMAAPRVEVSRMMKSGLRTFDARAAILSASVEDTVVLRARIAHVVPMVRPDDLLSALREAGGLAVSRPPLITRLAQGPIGENNSIGDPLMATK